MKKIVLVDASQLTYACSSVLHTKGLPDKLEDLVIRSIDKQIFDVTKGSQEYLPIVVFDSRPSFRLQIYPQYKGNRPNAPIDWGIIEASISEHYLHVKHPLLEADDLIYLISKICFSFGSHSIIVSSDSDMQQVVDMCNSLQYCPRKKDYISYPTQYDWINKVFLGDVSDNIPRILPKGVGPKTLDRIRGGKFGYVDVLEKYMIDNDDASFLCNYELVHFNMGTYRKYLSDIDDLVDSLNQIAKL